MKRKRSAIKRAKNRGVRAGAWWALLRGPDTLPVLFASRQAAREDCDPDEYPVYVVVSAFYTEDEAR